MKILLLQFTRRKDKQEENKRNFRNAFLNFGLEPEIIARPSVDDAPEKNEFKKYDRVIFSGSEFSFEGKNEPPEVRQTARDIAKRFEDFTVALRESTTPSLAICFGHQLWGYIFGEKVTQEDTRGKAGTFLVKQSDEGKLSPIFKGLSQEFYASYMHQDAICQKPAVAKILATGEQCNCATLDYGNNSFTTQFHPEFTKEVLEHKKEQYPKYFENQIEPQSEFKETPEAQKILRNFIEEF